MITDQDQFEEYYEALVKRDRQYIGVFYVGVKTTQVFCIATCRARKPKKENVAFYESAEEARSQGFRPCKICKPTSNAEEPPPDVRKFVQLLSEQPHRRFKDSDIREMGCSPASLRRWFKEHRGVTFQAYQRMIRLNHAVESLKEGQPVTATAFQTGYDSLSGFGYTFKHAFDHAPKNADDVNVLYLHRFTTALGPMLAGATAQGLSLLEFVDRKGLEAEVQKVAKNLQANIMEGSNELTQLAEQQISAYFRGELKEFDIPLKMSGTGFQRQVWEKLLTIPFGQTRSYKQQALAVGDEKAVRAVAAANGQNSIAIIIPCHRVIASDGSLTGYAGGLPRKKWLLEHEQKQLRLFD